MKKYIYAILAGTCLASTAQAEDVVRTVYVNQANVSNSSVYASAKGGLNMGNVKADGEKFSEDTFSLSAALGSTIVDFSNGALRGEIEYTYNEDLKDKGAEYDSKLLMANLYYDFDINSSITPYIGAGVGVAFNDVKYAENSDDNTSFAYSLSAGVNIPVNNTVSFDLGYRYLNMTSSDVTLGSDEIKVKPYSHQVLAGIRVSF